MESLRALVSSDATAIGQIVRAFTLPKEFGHGFRLASEGAGMESATADMSLQYNTTSWAAAVLNNQIPAQDLMGFLFGNPLRAFVFFDHNPTAAGATYNLVNAADNTLVFPMPTNVSVTVTPRYATVAGGVAPHGPILFPGYDEQGNIYTWVDNGTVASACVFQITFAPAPTTVNGGVAFYRWDGKHRVLYNAQAFVIGQAAYTTRPPVGGAYMMAEVFHTDPTVLTATVATFCNEGWWCHRPISDISTIITLAFGIRVNSASMKLQNNASEQDQNGNIISVTVSKSLPWTNIASGTDTLSGLQKYVPRVAKNGYYGFIVPDDDDDVSDFYDDIALTSTRNGTISQTAYPLSERRPYKAVGITVPIVAGRSVTFDVTHTIEYVTNAKTVEQGVSQFTEDEVKAAVVVLRSMDSDYDNPIHIGSILASIGHHLPTTMRALQQILGLFEGTQPASKFLKQYEPNIKEFGDTLMDYRQRKKGKNY